MVPSIVAAKGVLLPIQHKTAAANSIGIPADERAEELVLRLIVRNSIAAENNIPQPPLSVRRP